MKGNKKGEKPSGGGKGRAADGVANGKGRAGDNASNGKARAGDSPEKKKVASPSEDRFAALAPSNDKKDRRDSDHRGSVAERMRQNGAPKRDENRGSVADQMRKSDATSPGSEEKDGQGSRARDEVFAELRALLDTNSALQLSDFDYRIRQHLHALFGQGGRQRVHDALDCVRTATAKKTRQDVKNWPAYLGKLLKKVDDDIAWKDREARAKARVEKAAGEADSATKKELEDFTVSDSSPEKVSPSKQRDPAMRILSEEDAWLEALNSDKDPWDLGGDESDISPQKPQQLLQEASPVKQSSLPPTEPPPARPPPPSQAPPPTQPPSRPAPQDPKQPQMQRPLQATHPAVAMPSMPPTAPPTQQMPPMPKGAPTQPMMPPPLAPPPAHQPMLPPPSSQQQFGQGPRNPPANPPVGLPEQQQLQQLQQQQQQQLQQLQQMQQLQQLQRHQQEQQQKQQLPPRGAPMEPPVGNPFLPTSQAPHARPGQAPGQPPSSSQQVVLEQQLQQLVHQQLQQQFQRQQKPQGYPGNMAQPKPEAAPATNGGGTNPSNLNFPLDAWAAWLGAPPGAPPQYQAAYP